MKIVTIVPAASGFLYVPFGRTLIDTTEILAWGFEAHGTSPYPITLYGVQERKDARVRQPDGEWMDL